MSADESEDTSSPEEIRVRGLLVDASGDIQIAKDASSPADEFDDEYMARWYPSWELRAVVIGTIELPASVIVGSPEMIADGDSCRLEAGKYNVVGFEAPDDRLNMPAAVLRKVGKPIAHWDYVGIADDDNYVVVASEADLENLEAPRSPEGAKGSREWLRVGSTADETPFVWITNPTGNGMRAFAGVAADGNVVAVFVQLY